MKTLVTILLIVGVTRYTHGLTCFSCTDTDYNGEAVENCFSTVASGGTATATATCAADATGSVKYCRTMFTINDGVIISVARGCVASDGDHEANSAAVPAGNQCVTALDVSGNPTDDTDCYYSCTSDNCNTITTSSLQQCASDCNIGTSAGSCNYITGTCVCNTGFSGTDCGTADTATATTSQRSCVQCNSGTDTGCATSTASVACPGTETYCSTATTTIYDNSDAVIRTVTTRGCTSVFRAVDECTFTNIYTDAPISSTSVGYNEFTCYSTCDTNGCNTNTADGVIGTGEAITLQCLQCSDTTGAGTCNTGTRSTCPSGSTHCKSTVVYLISDRADLSYTGADPAYKLRSVVRECATAAVTSGCTESSVGNLNGLKKMTCTETCQGDGCNTGWPARPKCITCASDTAVGGVSSFADGYDECLENPPEAADCATPYHAYCVIADTGIQKGKRVNVQGYPRRMLRGCSHYDIGTGCTSTTLRTIEIENCNRTCTTDGCNVGSGSSMPIQTVIAVIVPAVLGWLAQVYL